MARAASRRTHHGVGLVQQLWKPLRLVHGGVDVGEDGVAGKHEREQPEGEREGGGVHQRLGGEGVGRGRRCPPARHEGVRYDPEHAHARRRPENPHLRTRGRPLSEALRGAEG
eukprot:1028759-Prorocentrum_minimum.AAC.1